MVVNGKGRLPAHQAMHEQRANHRRQQHAAQQVAVQVLDDFLQHERHRGNRRVEGRRQARRRARGRRAPPVLFRLARQPREVRRQSAGDVHARTFAAQAAAAADAQHAAQKFHPHRAPRDDAEIFPERRLWPAGCRCPPPPGKMNSANIPPPATVPTMTTKLPIKKVNGDCAASRTKVALYRTLINN